MARYQKEPRRRKPQAPQRNFTPALNRLFERYTTAKTPSEELGLRIAFIMGVFSEIRSSAGLDPEIPIEALATAPEFDMADNYDSAIAQEIAKGLVFYRAREIEIEASDESVSLETVLNAGAELGRTEYFALVGYMRALRPRALVKYHSKKGYNKLAEKAEKQSAWLKPATYGYRAHLRLLRAQAQVRTTDHAIDQAARSKGQLFAQKQGHAVSASTFPRHLKKRPDLIAEADMYIEHVLAGDGHKDSDAGRGEEIKLAGLALKFARENLRAK